MQFTGTHMIDESLSVKSAFWVFTSVCFISNVKQNHETGDAVSISEKAKEFDRNGEHKREIDNALELLRQF